MKLTDIQKQLSFLEERVQTESLHLRELRNIAEEAMRWIGQSSGKVHKLAEHLLASAQTAERHLIDRDVALFDRTSQLHARVQKLWLLQDRMTFDESGAELSSMIRELEELEKETPATYRAQDELSAVRAQVEEIFFEWSHPIVGELRPGRNRFSVLLMEEVRHA